MKRITIFRNNGSRKDGRTLLVTHSFEELLKSSSNKLGFNVKKLFNIHGGLIDDVDILRDDDLLFASDGSPFVTECPSNNYDGGCTASSSSNPNPPPYSMDEWITINVGGERFSTTRRTLFKEPDCMLARMFALESNWSQRRDAKGAYLIDRSPEYFKPLLNYLRNGQLIIDKNINPEGILEEARFYGVSSLITDLERLIEVENSLATELQPMSRRELEKILIGTKSEGHGGLRCQGVDFTGVNLSSMDLTNINFKFAKMRHVDLRGSNLSASDFERADLSYAQLDGAKMFGVRMSSANLEGASLQNCDFEDPSNRHTWGACLEGAHLKFANLEGSHLSRVNLRVANLKNSILRNCSLRGAVLAGADLEHSDLSGCDLTEANLRGANIKDASFTLMVHPIHMVQMVETRGASGAIAP